MRIRLAIAGVALVASIVTGCGSSSGDDDASSDGGTESTVDAAGRGDATDAVASPDAAEDGDGGSGGEGVTMTYPTTADVTELVDPSLVYTPTGGSADCEGTTADDSVCSWSPPSGDLDGTGQLEVRCGFVGSDAGSFVADRIDEISGSGRTAEELDGLGTPAVTGPVPDDAGYFISAFVAEGDRTMYCAFNLYAPYDGDAYGDADVATYTGKLTALARRSLGQEG